MSATAPDPTPQTDPHCTRYTDQAGSREQGGATHRTASQEHCRCQCEGRLGLSHAASTEQDSWDSGGGERGGWEKNQGSGGALPEAPGAPAALCCCRPVCFYQVHELQKVCSRSA